MISLYFGLPRSGKTTTIAYLAKKNSKKYKHVYINVHMKNLPSNCEYLPVSYLGKYNITDALILIDEASLQFDNRDYKSLNSSFRDWLMLHGHYGCDIYFFCQIYNAVDVKIRRLCENVFRIRKGNIFRSISVIERIPYGQFVGTVKDNERSRGTRYGDIDEGYYRLPFFVRLFSKRIFRPFYYRYFNSWEDVLSLPPMPSEASESEPSAPKK